MCLYIIYTNENCGKQQKRRLVCKNNAEEILFFELIKLPNIFFFYNSSIFIPQNILVC